MLQTPALEEPAPVQETVPTSEPSVSSDEEDVQAPPQELAPIQETAEVQETVESDMLMQTVDPTVATTTEAETVTVEATSTVEEIPVEPESPQPIEQSVPIEETTALEIVASVPAEAPRAETPAPDVHAIKPDLDPEYVFAVSEKTLPTKKKGKDGRDASVTNPVAAALDTDGDVHVSGSCANTYFVVLLFKNQEDYANDPRSYILNKAYPCESGAYSYSIEDLPPTLENGTYYLLIGEQGDRGTWSPITSLREITIKRSN